LLVVEVAVGEKTVERIERHPAREFRAEIRELGPPDRPPLGRPWSMGEVYESGVIAAPRERIVVL
jgi:hypothetical protein